MAKFNTGNYISIATGHIHTATEWEVSNTSDFSIILDRAYVDTGDITTWHSPIPKEDGTGYYSDLDNLYVRFRIYEGETSSDWFIVEPKNQNNQTVVYTENGQIVDTKNSLEIGFE